MDTLRWLNDDEFPFLTTPFHPPLVYAPPAGCVISIAKTAVLRPGAQKKVPNFVVPITKSRFVRHPPWREAISHPPISSPIKKPGGGGFASLRNAA
ncbi:chemotaxis protein CheW [Klebsiella sp. H-Nf2]|nr:chemotaxis protein CheW [Klebsiella sp. H-Nf2]PJX41468.1 chemotaxis protein CheW [Klebsiella sp. C-Nf10]PJX51843.1 chemotaxis protein CheW [Klebsiella sp. D-Nf1]